MNLTKAVWSSYYVDLSPEEMVDEFAKAGFFATEFSDEHGADLLKRAKENNLTPNEVGQALRKYAEGKGVYFPQGHLYLNVDLCSDEAEEVLTPWLELFVSLGIKAAVLHPSCKRDDYTEEMKFKRWVEVLAYLTNKLENTEMSIALENVGATPKIENLLNIIDAVKSEHLGICLDTGHLNLAMASGEADCNQYEFIKKAGDKLIALHIADNDDSRDQHLLPYSIGKVSFKDVMKGLKEIGYKGLFNFEIPGERRAPLKLRKAKLDYISAVFDALVNEEFYEN